MTTPSPKPSRPIPITQKFEDFYRLFQETPGVYKYLDRINDIYSKGGNTLIFLFEDLLAFDSQIADLLKNDPEALLEDAVDAFKSVLKFQSGGIHGNQNYFVRVTTKDDKSPLSVPIRKLRSKNIDKLVLYKGILIRISIVRPKLVEASFECHLCAHTFEIIQLTASIKWPRSCVNPRCKAKAQSDFRLISKNSEFIDWQSITIQEMPEDLPSGRIPRSVQAILKYDLVDAVKPGDRLKVLGIFKSVLAQSIKGMNSTLFKSYVDVNYIEPEDKSEEFIDISKEDKKQIEKLSKEPLIQKKIARSICPTIYGRDDLKMACALSIFSGTKKMKPSGGHKRGDIHVLFVGDPGTGKSIHGSEKIYVGKNTSSGINWRDREIGEFFDSLINKNKEEVISRGGTKILKLSQKSPKYTFSINLSTLKTQKSKINEVSRHKANTLVQIKTESGRSIVATPNHSFTTLIDGELRVIDSEYIYEHLENLYLPIAREIDFDVESNIADMSEIFNVEDLVRTKTIRTQISEFSRGRITLREAAKNANIARSTLLSYKKNPDSIPNGDCIRRKLDSRWIQRKINLNSRFGRIIGFYLAEGDLQKSSVRISNTNEEVKALLENDITDIFKGVAVYDNSVEIHISSLAIWFKRFFGKYAHHKKIYSSFITNAPSNFRRGLLSAYFTGDGTIEKDALFISATTASKKLAYSISDMLSTFGIFSTIKIRELKSGKYKGNIYYQIILTGAEVIKFDNRIGFLSTEKQQKLENVIVSSSRSRYQKKDIIPNFGNILQRICSDLELIGRRDSWERNFMAELRGKTQRQRAGRLYLKKIMNTFEELYNEKDREYSNDLIWLKTLINSDILWDKVKEINEITYFEDIFVYDIGTDDGHFIVADGNLIVHNSEILKSAVEVSPRGLYTSGKGSSGVGLTAAVIKETETGQMNLEAGAIVLANGGIAAIDEFDKMDPGDRSALHEGMAQQTVSIAKAGIVATLKAETAIIAAANPRYGRFNEYKTFVENTNMPPSLLSRFDLIFKVIDRPDPAKDAQMAEFILNNAMLVSEEDFKNIEEDKLNLAPISGDILKKYIKYAKRNCFPILSEEAKEEIKDFYLELRGKYDSEDAVVSILARNLDALVRLSEAYAKMALRNKVVKEDVEEILKLFKRYLRDTGYDKETRKIDVDILFTGQPRSKINKLTRLMDRLKELFEVNEWKALEKKNIIQILELEENLDRDFIKNAIKEAIDEGTLYCPKNGFIKFTSRQE